MQKQTWPAAAEADIVTTMKLEQALYARYAKASSVTAIKTDLTQGKALIAARIAASTHVRTTLDMPQTTTPATARSSPTVQTGRSRRSRRRSRRSCPVLQIHRSAEASVQTGATLHLRVVASPTLDRHSQLVMVFCCQALAAADTTTDDPTHLSYPIRNIQGQTEPLWFCNEHRLITHATAAQPPLLGYAPIQLLGRDPCEFLHPDDVGIWQEMWHWALAETGRSQSAVIRIQSSTGQHHWVEHNAINYLTDPAIASIIIHGRTNPPPASRPPLNTLHKHASG